MKLLKSLIALTAVSATVVKNDECMKCSYVGVAASEDDALTSLR